MSKVLVVGDNGNCSARTKMLAEILCEAGHDVVYEIPESKPLAFIFDECHKIPLTQPEKKVTISPSTLLVKLIGRIK